jgi:ribose transport system substrate-binding protein
MRKPLALCAALVALVVLAAGCGSSGSSSSSGGSSTSGEGTSTTVGETSGGTGETASAAEAKLEELVENPPTIKIPPLKKAPPTGKTVTWMGCPLPVCVQVGEGIKGAAETLGWTFKEVNQGLTPDTVQAAWNGLVQDPGDAVLAAGVLPNSAIKKQLEQLKADGVPYVGVTQIDPPNELMEAAVSAPNQMKRDGEALASWVVTDAGGEPSETILVYDPSLTPVLPSVPAFEETMEELCPECTITDLKISASDAGTKVPEEVVNELRTHPDAKYVVFNLGDLAAGVPAAVRRADLPSEPKIVTRAATTTTMADIKNGGVAAGLTIETPEGGWRGVDLILRLMNGEKLYSKTPIGGMTFLTEENLPEDISVPYTIPGFEEVFEKAWGK